MYIIPEPLHMTVDEAWNALGLGTEIIVDESVDGRLFDRLRPAIALLKAEIEKLTACAPEIRRSRNKEKLTGCDVILSVKQGIAEGETVSPEEAYEIQVDDDIIVYACDFAGFLYGIQTLRQIIRQNGAIIPMLQIIDGPKIKRRGLSLDITRGRIPTMEELKRQVDTLAFYKMNELQLYVEHSFAFAEETEVWRGSDPLNQEDILELDRYCRQYNIDLVPSLASFGHLYELLQTHSYRDLCELPGWGDKPFSLIDRMAHHTVDVSNEKSFEVLAGRIKEYGELFTSRYFNICADETFDLCTGRSKELGEEKGVKRVYLDFLTRLCEVVKSIGKIPMFWGDVLLEDPSLLAKMPEDAIILNWEYSPEVTEDKTRVLREAGVAQMYLCPGVQSWNRLVNSHSIAYKNIAGMCANAHKYKARGVLNTEWGDLGHPAYPGFSTVGQIYGAAFSWSETILPEADINKAISVVEYGDKAEEIVELFKGLGDLSALKWWNLVRYKETKGTPECVETLSGVMDRRLYSENVVTKMLLLDGIRKKLSEVSPEARPCVSAYLLMGEGEQRLEAAIDFLISMAGVLQNEPTGNKFEHMLWQGMCDLGRTHAARLEEWFAQFKKLWRSVSRESELQRVADVIFWYADALRGGLPGESSTEQ